MSEHCQKMERLIIDYVMGELGSSDAAAVEEHVKSCLNCSEALNEFRQVVSGLSRCEMLEPSAALCEKAREAVRDKALGRRALVTTIARLAASFARRPVLAGATALAAIAAAVLLFVVPGGQGPGQRPDEPIGGGATALRELRDYLSESEKLIKMAQSPKASETLASHDRDYWMLLVGRAMSLREQGVLEGQYVLLDDLEELYRRILACGGTLDEKEVEGIRQLIVEKKLRERTNEAVRLQR